MNYFGKEKKLKVFFFFLGKNLRTKQTSENTGKCLLYFFFFFIPEMQPNTVKYFTEIIFRKIFYSETNRPLVVLLSNPKILEVQIPTYGMVLRLN